VIFFLWGRDVLISGYYQGYLKHNVFCQFCPEINSSAEGAIHSSILIFCGRTVVNIWYRT